MRGVQGTDHREATRPRDVPGTELVESQVKADNCICIIGLEIKTSHEILESSSLQLSCSWMPRTNLAGAASSLCSLVFCKRGISSILICVETIFIYLSVHQFKDKIDPLIFQL